MPLKFQIISDLHLEGTPLWFPDQPGNKGYEGMLNDFRLIRGFRRDVYAAHAKALQFLEGELRQGDVVVTHHLPAALVSCAIPTVIWGTS